MITVPQTRFRRELKKWLRHIDKTGDTIRITQRFGPDLICVPYDNEIVKFLTEESK